MKKSKMSKKQKIIGKPIVIEEDMIEKVPKEECRKTSKLLDNLSKRFENLLKMDGFDDCAVGVVVRYGQEPILCYSYDKVIGKLMEDGITEEEAEEFFEYNQIGAWFGDRTPCFLVEK